MERNQMNWSDKLINKYTTDKTDKADKGKNTDNPSSVSSVDNPKVIFYASLEGTNEKVSYSYYELKHTFKEGFTDDSIRFIHMAKKHARDGKGIKFIKEIKEPKQQEFN